MPAKPKATSASRAGSQTGRIPPGWNDPLAPNQPLISGRWIAGAALCVVAMAAVAAYLTLCLLFYQGQWQVVFHPSRSVATTPAALGMKYDEVRFDYTQTGSSQLAGWWIPAASANRAESSRGNQTILYFHDGRGSIADTAAQLKRLHELGVNLFAFDYRGFGNSIDTHPSEQRVYEDADAAWAYLTDIRHLDSKSIVFYGQGLGATIASETALRHPESPALILENPSPPALTLIEADARTSVIPIKWLFRDRFVIAPRLQQLGFELTQPVKGLIANGKPSLSTEIVRVENLNPKATKLLLLLGPDPEADPHYFQSIDEFLSAANATK